jgi:hypothetical protein
VRKQKARLALPLTRIMAGLSDLTQMVMFMKFEQQKATFYAIQLMKYHSTSPFQTIADDMAPVQLPVWKWWRSQSPILAIEEALLARALRPAKAGALTGVPRSREFLYTLSGEVEDWADDKGNSAWEMERRHPGDKPEDDTETDYEAWNDLFSPLATKAGGMVQTIHFVDVHKQQDGTHSPLEGSTTSLRAAYPMQLLLRVDTGRKLLVYDCFEYKPETLSSTYRAPKGKAWNEVLKSLSFDSEYDDYSDSGSDEADEEGEEEDVNEDDLRSKFEAEQYHNICSSRIMRCRVALSSIQGIQLLTSGESSGESAAELAQRRMRYAQSSRVSLEEQLLCNEGGPGQAGEGVGILVLELSSPPKTTEGADEEGGRGGK